MKKKFNMVKFCAVFTTVCFLFSTFGSNLYAVSFDTKYGDVFDSKNVSCISNEYGKITSNIDSGSEITVINIQDLHCHPQTQKNISKIIKEIADNYNLKEIYVEGGYGNIDTDWINQIKDENIRKQTIEKLLENGILTGSEYYKLTQDKKNIKLIGLDDEKIHKDNIDRLSKIIKKQQDYKDVIEKVNKEISILEKIYVNKKNEKFNEIIDKYTSNQIDDKKFYRLLFKYVNNINNKPENYNNITSIRIEDYPNINNYVALRYLSRNVNQKEVSHQLSLLIEELKAKIPYGAYSKLLKETENFSNSSKTLELLKLLCDKSGISIAKYDALEDLFETSNITKNLNFVELVQEERDLVSEIRKALSYDSEEYEITFLADFNTYFQRYLEYKLTDAEWKYFKKEYSLFRQIYNKYASFDRIKEIETDFAELNKYYDINDERNNIFVNNILSDTENSILGENKTRTPKEMLKQSKEVIVVVSGGFHSSELEKILSERKINAVVITPFVTGDIQQAEKTYSEIIELQSKINSQAIAYTLLSSAGNVAQRNILYGIIKKEVEKNPGILKTIFGEDIDINALDNVPQIATLEGEQDYSFISEIINIEVESLIKMLPTQGGKTILFPDMDKLILGISTELVNAGIFLSRGVIFDAENLALNGRSLEGIPAEVYSRMHPDVQKGLIQKASRTSNLTETTSGLRQGQRSNLISFPAATMPTTAQEKGRDFNDEEKELLQRNIQEQQEFYDSIYTYRMDKRLQQDVSEIFENLLDAMVTLHWITPEERSQYKLHFYYNPEVNAFTLRNSSDVYIFSQLLFELDRYLKKDGKHLTKDIIAAVLAHELRHTIQEVRIYEYEDKTKTTVSRIGSSKRNEYDADTGGLEILDVAGYNPKAMRELMECLDKFTGDSVISQLCGLMGAHPEDKDRIKVLSSILESKDVAFMHADRPEQEFSNGVKIKKYFKIKPRITKLILRIGNKLGFVRRIIFHFLLTDKANFFSQDEKEFLRKASNAQRKYIYKLMFYTDPDFEEERFTGRMEYFNIMSKLSVLEKEELFDFIIDKLNILKVVKDNNVGDGLANMSVLFYGRLVTSIDMTPERWERLNKFRKLTDISINAGYLDEKEMWFYKINHENLSEEEERTLYGNIAQNNERFLESPNINRREYLEFVYSMFKTRTPIISGCSDLIIAIDKASFFTDDQKKELFYKLTYSFPGNYVLSKVLDLTEGDNVKDRLVNLFDFVAQFKKEPVFVLEWYSFLTQKYLSDLSTCSVDDLKAISLSYKRTGDVDLFSVFYLGWLLKSISPDTKIYFVNGVEQSKNPKYSDGVCLWKGMFKEGKNTEIILQAINMVIENEIKNELGIDEIDKESDQYKQEYEKRLLTKLKAFQNELIGAKITDVNISFITYKILKEAGLWNTTDKYELTYMLCLLKTQDDVLIETDATDGSPSSYPMENLKDIVEIQFPQAAHFDIGEKYRFTKYFINLTTLRKFSLDYNENLEDLISKIKNRFDVANTYFKPDKRGRYPTRDHDTIKNAENNLRNIEISKVFIYKMHEVFGLKPIQKSMKFKTGEDEYTYDYFEINPDIFDQVLTEEQAQELINIFFIVKKELSEESAELYAKILYKVFKNNPNLSVFASVDENIKLLDFLFEGFSKAKDDYINELMDRHDITPSQYLELKKRSSLSEYSQATEKANKSVAKGEILYATINSIVNQEDRINFFLWLISPEDDSAFYRTYIMGNTKCKNNENVDIDFSSLKRDFLLMTKTEKENVIRTIFLGSNGVLNNENRKENMALMVKGLQNVFFNNLFFDGESANATNVAMGKIFKKIFEIVFTNVNDERKVIFVNNLFSALIDIKLETENSNYDEGELRARQLGRLIVAIGVNSGMAVLKLLQILSNNKVFEQLDEKYGPIINEEVSKVKSENEPLSKFVIFKYFEMLGMLDDVEYVGECLGSASIGLTYFVKFKGRQTPDVVKIKRPNLMKNYDEDFFVFEKLRKYIVSDFSPLPGKYKKMIPRTEHLKNIFQDELNFEEESENLERFARQITARKSSVGVPRLINNGVYLFTQTKVNGTSLNKLSLPEDKRKDIYFEILKEFCTELFSDSQISIDGTALYHADLHAGNIFVDDDGNITFIDLGGVGKTNTKTSKSLKMIFLFLCMGNYSGFLASLNEYDASIVKQLSASDKQQIKKILTKKVPLENKFADLFEVFNNLQKTNKDFLMFMQSISKIAAYIDGLNLMDYEGHVNMQDVLKYLGQLLNKNLDGLDKVINAKQDSLKQLAVSIYTKKFDNFIAALSSYDSNMANNLTDSQKKEIAKILKSTTSLQDRILNLVEILKTVKGADENLFLILESAERVINYIGEQELKNIIKKLVVSEVKNRFFKFSLERKAAAEEATEQEQQNEEFTLMEIIADKCTDLSKGNRVILEKKLKSVNKEAIIKCLRNSIYDSTVKQIIEFIDIAEYLYENGFINDRTESDKINLLFKTINTFDFKAKQIKELFEMEPLIIDEILAVLKGYDTKKKQTKTLNKFLKEKDKLDLEDLDVEIMKILLSNSSGKKTIISRIPVKIAKELWKNEEKLNLILDIIRDIKLEKEVLRLSLILKLVDLDTDTLQIIKRHHLYTSTGKVNLSKFCDLYKVLDGDVRDKFYNKSSFVNSLLSLTVDEFKDFELPMFFSNFAAVISNVMVVLMFKVPFMLKIVEFIKSHKRLSQEEKQNVNLIKRVEDTDTLEEIVSSVYDKKRGIILREATKLNIPMNIENIQFKALLSCAKKSVSVTSEIGTKLQNLKTDEDFDEFGEYINNIAERREELKERMRFLDNISFIWEEGLFRFIPSLLSIFNPVIGFYTYVSSQVVFIIAHIIPKLLGKKKFSDIISEIKELTFSLPMFFFTTLGFLLLLNFAIATQSYFDPVLSKIAPILATVVSLITPFIHRKYNEEHEDNPLSIIRQFFDSKKGNIQRQTIVKYRFISAEQAEQIAQSNEAQVAGSAEGNNVVEVYIIDNIENLPSNYELVNTGMKYDDKGIFKIKAGNVSMYGVRGAASSEVAKMLNDSKYMNKEIKSNFSLDGKIELDGVIIKKGQGISFNGGLLEVGESEITGKDSRKEMEYIMSALRVKNAVGIMYGDKTLIDLNGLSDKELVTAIENGRARKVITEAQFDKLNLSREKVLALKEQGIELYIRASEINENYESFAISGQIITEDGVSYIYDYFNQEKTVVEEIPEEEDFISLEQKLINSDVPILVGIEILKKNFKRSNPIETFSMFAALIGKIKMTTSFGNITQKDIESIGYNIKFENIPNMSGKNVTDLINAKNKADIISIIGADNEFAIILNSIKDEDILNRFITLTKERILAKKELIESGNEIEGIELIEKKYEVLLGKMLLRKEANKYPALSDEEIKELMNNITHANLSEQLRIAIEELESADTREAESEQVALVNKIILMLLYSERKGGKGTVGNNISVTMEGYRAMLSAA